MIQKPWVRNLVIAAICLFVVYGLYAMRMVLSPVFIALALAYVLDPVIDRFESWKISRTWGIVLLCFLMFIALLGLSLYLVPRLLSELSSLSQTLPEYWNRARDQALPYLNQYVESHPEEMEQYRETAIAWAQENAGVLLQSVTSGLAASFKSIGAFLGNLLGLVMIPVLAFYLLRDFDLMVARIGNLVPIKRRPAVFDLFSELHATMSNFIKGQLLVALMLSVIYTIGLEIANCPASLLIGVLAGFANLIPYLGIALGFVPAVLLTYLSGNPSWQIVAAGLTFVVGQMLEGMVITPKVVGESVGLHPVVVLVGLTIGGTYFGFLGMILALPATAILMVLLRRTYIWYTQSLLYHDGEVNDSKPSETSSSSLEETTAGAAQVVENDRHKEQAGRQTTVTSDAVVHPEKQRNKTEKNKQVSSEESNLQSSDEG